MKNKTKILNPNTIKREVKNESAVVSKKINWAIGIGWKRSF